jgi:GlpG protein
MRLIGHLRNEDAARTFSRFLVSRDIRNQVEADTDGWAVWIHSEDQIEAGQRALEAYVRNPNDRVYMEASAAAEAIEKRERRDAAKAAKRIRNSDQIWTRSGLAPFTLTLIGISVIVTLAIGLDPHFPDFHWLAISELHFFYTRNLPEVRDGQVWRLITPIFVHFGPLHLLFNMLWLRDLGTMIEVRQGARKLSLLVAIIGIASNLGQYWLPPDLGGVGPNFGGMSGVLYGLFGYIWMRGKCDPGSGLGLHPTTVLMMIAWFFLCLFGLLGDVANGTHAVGLILGMAWGAAPMAKRLFGG